MSTDDQDCKSCVPVEEPAASESAEESTVDLPNEVSTTDVRVEQSTSSIDGKINCLQGKEVAQDMLPKDGDT